MAWEHKSGRRGVKIRHLQHCETAHKQLFLPIHNMNRRVPVVQELCSCVLRFLLKSTVSFCSVRDANNKVENNFTFFHNHFVT